MQSELSVIHNCNKLIEQLERDKESLLENYANIAPEALDSLTPEDRHQLYKMLRLSVVIRPDANLEVSGAFREGVPLSKLEFLPKKGSTLRSFLTLALYSSDASRHSCAIRAIPRAVRNPRDPSRFFFR